MKGLNSIREVNVDTAVTPLYQPILRHLRTRLALAVNTLHMRVIRQFHLSSFVYLTVVGM